MKILYAIIKYYVVKWFKVKKGTIPPPGASSHQNQIIVGFSYFEQVTLGEVLGDEVTITVDGQIFKKWYSVAETRDNTDIRRRVRPARIQHYLLGKAIEQIGQSIQQQAQFGRKQRLADRNGVEYYF